MKYIIASKGVRQGKQGDDSSSLQQYFELGWEMTTSHFLVKRMLKENKIEKDDIIVTQKDRIFLYDHLHKTISCDDFDKITEKKQYVDLVSYISSKGFPFFTDFYTPDGLDKAYKFFEEDKEINTSFHKLDVTHLHNNNPFICLAIRKRDHCGHRNMDDGFAKELLTALKTEVDTIFIGGKGSENFCDNVRTKYVSLQEFASLCNEPNCLVNVGSLTGIMYLPLMFSRAKYNIIIDLGCRTSREFDIGLNIGHPLLMAKCIRYSNSIFVKNERNIPEIIELIRSSKN